MWPSNSWTMLPMARSTRKYPTRTAFERANIEKPLPDMHLKIFAPTKTKLNACMKDIVFMKVLEPEVDLFCKIDPTFKQFVIQEKGSKVLFVQLDGAL